MNSFHITDVIYNSEIRKLTYKLLVGENPLERVTVGYSTVEEIAGDFQAMLEKYFSKT